MKELCDISAFELANLIRKKEVSAQEALTSTYERIDQVEGRTGVLNAGEITADDKKKVHAFITLTKERAFEQAKIVDQKIGQGEIPGLLAGVPFSVKDIFCVKDTPSTAASKILANFTAPYTATTVQRLEKAGGLMIGKVNLDEFTYGSSNESSAFQPHPRNPWNTNHVTGGSSGGSVAAVSAGEGHLSLGTDTAGSIRQPAAFCGVVGLKPTYGRVSRYGLIAFGSSLDCPGPVSRNVTDAALMMNVISGSDPKDSTTASIPTPNYLAGIEEGVKGMRIGLSEDYFQITYFNHKTGEIDVEPVPDEIRRSVEKVADILSGMGARIIENIPMPHTKYGIPAYFVISRVEASSNLHRFDGVKYGHRTQERITDLHEMYRRSRAEGFGLQPKLRILMGMYVSAAQYSEQYYKKALQIRTLIRQDFDKIYDPNGDYKLDALLTPTTPTSAFPIGGIYGDSVLMQYADQLTVCANHAGIPGVSIPAGFDKEGLPLGIQFLGDDYTEAKIMRIARAYEIETETASWRAKKPSVINNL